jgi:ubiquitin thioesterase OTU1
MKLKLTCSGRKPILAEFEEQLPFSSFRRDVAAAFELDPSRTELYTGFPPRLLAADDAALLGACIKSGSAVDVRLVEDLVNIVDDAPSPPLAARVASPQLPPAAAPTGWTCSACTFHNAAADARHCAVCGTGRGLERQVVPADNTCLFTSVGYVLDASFPGACAALRPLVGSTRRMERGGAVRAAAADHIAAHPEEFSDAVLGRPAAEYLQAMRRRETWGGGIECRALSELLGLELAVLDIRSLSVARFGEDRGFAHRAFLLYDGLHYDPLQRSEATGAVTAVFRTADEAALAQAMAGACVLCGGVGCRAWVTLAVCGCVDVAMRRPPVRIYITFAHVFVSPPRPLPAAVAAAAHAQRQYTDTTSFTLRCGACGAGIKGQAEAMAHARATGHASFQEFD